jgi:hypothetical protein
MDVAISHHIDASEPDENGFYDYHYEYDIYEFERAGRTYFVRAYVDEPDQAAFMSCLEAGKARLLDADDLMHPLLLDAARYLHAAGKMQLDRLSEFDGYVRLELPAPPDRD